MNIAALSLALGLNESAAIRLGERAEEFQAIIGAHLDRLTAEDTQLKKWQDFYWKAFKRELDVSSLKIPAKVESFSQLIVVAGWIRPAMVHQAVEEIVRAPGSNALHNYLREPANCWQDNALYLRFFEHDRDPSQLGSYAIWAYDQDEAARRAKKFNEIDIKRPAAYHTKGWGMTVLESALVQLKSYYETGSWEFWTHHRYCPGSRRRDGSAFLQCRLSEQGMFTGNMGSNLLHGAGAAMSEVCC